MLPPVACDLGEGLIVERFDRCAVEIHERLAAITWERVSREALAAVIGRRPTLRRHDRTWEIAYRMEVASVPDSKGIRDLAVLLGRPGVDVHVLELSGSPIQDAGAIELVDRTALAQYRQRLVDLEDDIAEAEHNYDTERLALAEAERDALLDELRVVAGLGGSPRLTGAQASERARKAVSARIKDAVRHIEPTMPQLAGHIRQSIITGIWCRYRPDTSESWIVET